jgi:hypothetical protein
MKKMLAVSVFTLATLAWAAAQQAGGPPGQSGRQGAYPQPPGTTQSQPGMPDSTSQDAGQSGSQAGSQGPAANVPVTEGCLGGNDPNYTITDKTGTTYKLNIPPSADTSKLKTHIGESVQVAGDVNNAGGAGSRSISVQGIGRGMGTCPANGTSGTPPTPKQ